MADKNQNGFGASKRTDSIFNRTLEIKGKHGDMVRDLSENLNCRNLDVFFASILAGLWQGRTAEIDADSAIEPAKIDSQQMVTYNDDIEYFFRLAMLADEKYCIAAQKRSDKAFRHDTKNMSEDAKKDEAHFIKTMLGGLEFLHEQIKIQGDANKSEEIFENIYRLCESYDDYSQDVSEESLRSVFFD